MVETPEDEVTQDDTEEVEETTVEAEDDFSSDDEVTQDDIAEMEEDHSSLLASLGADLEFLHGDNMSFYQANKAYYEDRNYEEAIAEFQAAIEYEKLQPPNPPDSAEDSAKPKLSTNEIIAKSMYWIGEAYVKLNQIDQAVKAFGQLSRRFKRHYLAPAARRRIDSLELHKESESA